MESLHYMNQALIEQLKESVKYLGATLGETIKEELGDKWLETIETIRHDGRHSSKGDAVSTEALANKLASLDNQSLLTIARAFAQFLTLANIAEQEFNIAADQDTSRHTT